MFSHFIQKKCCLAVVALLATSVSVSFAQDEKSKGGGENKEKKERRRGGGGGGGGGQGFGGGRGMGRPGGGMMMAGPPVQLLNNENVAKELKISDDEKAFIKILEDLNRSNFTKAVEDNPDFWSEDNAEKRTAFFKKQSQETEDQLKEIIGADRYKRLNQINYQIMGTMSFNSEKVQKELSITKEQQTKLREAAQALMEENRETFADFRNMSEEERAKAMKEMRAKGEAKAMTVLTDSQRKKWSDMQGEKIAFTVDPFSGFGGRRGGGGGFGGGGGGGGGGRRDRKQGDKKSEGGESKKSDKKPPA